ncbi:hypothetical protein PHYSODRAFT_293398 [Phytophthora sojae]|uniref:Chromo domain-containing protein n=1 Tax=Phytophthora sojae (strain P6497) TaxID=1094619 RepID=G4YF03_PHYSP|nr:hypothetical protein PHYSODRAFT_293398 [Phytophthora sojae]EGZ27586.1 hypothetical protein PHYSODRAFT_293398 [Phytophthora sojae]|eukprot:XP_009514861.1 hypothetical protein PHYSODRAFT_293398 [Phytophthora sojae]
MTPQNARQRRSARFACRDDRVWRVGRPSAPVPRLVATGGADGSDDKSDDDNFIATGGIGNAPAVPTADASVVRRLWATRHINQVTFYLIQWEGYDEITWELVARFEVANRDSVWEY